MTFRPGELGGSQLALASSTGTLVTVVVKTSTGAPLPGACVRSYLPGPSWVYWGCTGPDGTISRTLQSGDWYFEVSYANTMVSRSVTVGTVPLTLEFQTVLVTVELKTCAGAGLKDGKVRYFGNVSPLSPNNFGTTGPDGRVSRELFPGTFTFDIEYRQTMTAKQQDVGANPVVTFTTTKVELYHTGTIQYWGNPSTGTLFGYSRPMEMLPGTIRFVFAGIGTIPITVSGCEYKGALVVVELKDSAGNPLSGAKVMRMGGPVSPRTWFPFGTTDSGGRAYGFLPPGYDYVFEVQYNWTSAQQSGRVPDKLKYSFQTSRVTVELKTCTGLGLAGGRVRYFGSISPLTPQTFGTTDANGRVSRELFPGTYSFDIQYNQTMTAKTQNVGLDPVVVFTTTKVVSSYAGTIFYRGNPSTGTWFRFTSPMEMLPGVITFSFNGTIKTFDISGCVFEIGPG